MEAIIIAAITGCCTLVAAFVAPLLSRRSRRRKELVSIKKELDKLPESPLALFLSQAAEQAEQEKMLDVIWMELIAETSDDRLEIHLAKIDSIVEKNPKDARSYALKELVNTAIRNRDRKRSTDSRFRKLLTSITFESRRLLALLIRTPETVFVL